MSGPNELMESTEAPTVAVTKDLNESINNTLEPYGGRERTLWLFILATKYYEQLSGEDRYDISDYQIAAEMAVKND